jgi:hypothetical protein
MLAPLLLSGVLVVAPVPGPGVDHTSIQDAVLAAHDGDIVLVRSGDYAGDVYVQNGGKNLALIADGATPPQSSQGVWNFHAQQPWHTAIVRGFQLNGFFASLPYTTAALQVGAGNVFVEDCTIHGSHTCVHANDSGWLALTRCTANASSASGPGATSVVGVALATQGDASSLATLHACSLRGGKGLFGFASGFTFGIAAREGVNWKGKLIASRSAIDGGTGAGSAKPQGYCVSSSPGGGVVIEGVAHLASSSVAAGAQGPLDPNCTTPYVPPAIGGGTTIVHAGSAPLLSSSRVTREGEALAVALETTSGEYAVLLAATSVQRSELDDFVGVLVNSAANLTPLGVVGASGSVGASATIQDLGAGVEGAVLLLQGASVDLATFSVRLSNISVSVLVDAGI